MLGGAGEILLRGLARDPELIGDLLNRVASETMQYERRRHPGWQLSQDALQALDALRVIALGRRIFARG